MDQPIGSTPEVAPPQEAAPTYRLFTPDEVGIATFLGSPLAGGFLMMQNLKRLGRPSLAPLWMGLLGTLLSIVVGLLVPYGGGLGLALVFVMRHLAQTQQGPTVLRHRELGGRYESPWTAAVVGLVSFLMVFSVAFVGAMAYDTLNTASLRVSDLEEVRYERRLGEPKAQALADFLKKIEFFDGQGGATVALRQEKDGFVVGFVVRQGIWDQPDMIEAFTSIKSDMAREVFQGAPLQLELLDDNLQVHKTL